MKIFIEALLKKMNKYLLENFTLLENLAQMWKI